MHGALTNEPASSLLDPGALSWGASPLTAIHCYRSGGGSWSQSLLGLRLPPWSAFPV